MSNTVAARVVQCTRYAVGIRDGTVAAGSTSSVMHKV